MVNEDELQDSTTGISSSSSSSTRIGWAIPLWLQRRTACLNVLRKQGVRSCVEFGCGNGSVLSVCTAPAWSKDDFPSLYPPDQDEDQQPPLKRAKLQVLRRVPRVDPERNELHLTRLAGVDVRPDSLKQAIELTKPPPVDPENDDDDDFGSSSSRERWQELTVELWEGGMETYNEAFDNLDAIIVTEVIEHLSPKALDKAEQILLSVYSPRVMIVTTPNYSFNPWFPLTSDTEHQVPDPTHRTNRKFRDADHQFEMTEREFEQWATALAKDNDYKVTFDGVGSLADFCDPVPERAPSIQLHPELLVHSRRPADPKRFFATQIAIFERQLSYEPERSPRSHRMQPLPFLGSVIRPYNNGHQEDTNGNNAVPPKTTFTRQSIYPHPHILRTSHVHALNPPPARVRLEQPDRILELVDSFFVANERLSATLAEVWTASSVRRACAGQTAALVDAALESDAWNFELDRNEKGMDALVLVRRDHPREQRNDSHAS